MEAIAKLKHLKGSPRKARLVIDLIRGQNVSNALSILKFTDKRAALPIAKCLNSAIANATYLAEQQNIAIDPDDLWVNLCYVDMGPTKNRRRMRPAPQGRAYREQRHYCHITIQVTSEEKAKTEKQLLAEAARSKKPMGKKLAAKAAGKDAKPEAKETKKAKTEEVVEVVEPVVEEVVETTPVETAAPEVVEEPTPAEVVEEAEAKSDADVSAAKEASTHTTAEENATKPVDEVMEKTNEDLERQ